MNDLTKEELEDLRYELDSLMLYMQQDGSDWEKIWSSLIDMENILYPERRKIEEDSEVICDE